MESDGARTLVEGAEERGFIEPAELEAFALEHELNEEEVEQLSQALEDRRQERLSGRACRRTAGASPRIALPSGGG